MRRHQWIHSAVIFGVTLLAFQGLASAQQKITNPRPLFKISITSDSTILTRDKPALVTVTIENISGAELELSSSGSLHLASLSKESLARKHQVVGDSYWSPVNLADSTTTEIKITDEDKLKQGIVVGRAAQVPIQFSKDETKTFKIDLTKVFWNASMSSMWPTEFLFKVVRKGTYSLSVNMKHKGVNVESNPIEVSVK